METILVVGATGNIGVSAIQAALRSKYKVLAVVRNQASAEKLIKYIGSSEGITIVEANVLSDSGIKSVVDQVRAGKLPPFQHVFSSVGGEYTTVPLKDITLQQLRYNMNASFEANFFAYQQTIPYLLQQQHPTSTWTSCTGSQGDLATHPMPAMTQGALFSMATAASRENAETNIRFNEIYLGFRVEVDAIALEHGVTPSSEFAAVYEQLLERPDIRGSRVSVQTLADMKELRYRKKVQED